MPGRNKRSKRRGVPTPGDPPSNLGGAGEDEEAAAIPSPQRRSSSGEQIPEPALPPEVQRATKRTSATQEVPLTSPARQHPASKSRSMLSNIKVTGVKLITPKDGGEAWYQAMFSVMLEKKKVQFKTNKEIWLSRECEMVMNRMQQTIKRQAMLLQIDLDSLSEDVLMSSSMPWEKAWVSFENDVLKLQMKQLELSSAASLGHKSKAETTLEKRWTIGEDYKGRQSKFRAKSRLITELELVSSKELVKAQSVLSSVISDMMDEPSFDELSVLSSDTRNRLAVINASVASAASIMSKMTKSLNLGTAKLLIAVTAILLPENCLDPDTNKDRQVFCKTFSINGRAKYFETAFENRKEYSSFVQLDGDISVGEKLAVARLPKLS